MTTQVEVQVLVNEMAGETWMISNWALYSRNNYYLTLLCLDDRVVIPVLIAEIKKPDTVRVATWASISLLRDITGENPDHYAYKPIVGGWQAWTVADSIRAWVKWYEDGAIDEIPL